MKKVISAGILSGIIAFMITTLVSCATQEKQNKEPEPLVINSVPDATETEELEKAVSDRVNEIMSGDVHLTVYCEGVEDFSYYGKLKLIDDGSDGSDVIIFVYPERKTTESDWW